MTRIVNFSDSIRSSVLVDSSEDLIEAEDSATLLQTQTQDVVSNQYVVYSPTFQVPTFYFTMHNSSASLLSAPIQSSLTTTSRWLAFIPWRHSQNPIVPLLCIRGYLCQSICNIPLQLIFPSVIAGRSPNTRYAVLVPPSMRNSNGRQGAYGWGQGRSQHRKLDRRAAASILGHMVYGLEQCCWYTNILKSFIIWWTWYTYAPESACKYHYPKLWERPEFIWRCDIWTYIYVFAY